MYTNNNKERKEMRTYNVKVVVEYEYEVDVENEELAEKEGWNYEEYAHHASVYSIDVEDITEEDEEESEDEDA
jgi:hypothetical protein